jgi:hypothetical protein
MLREYALALGRRSEQSAKAARDVLSPYRSIM